MTTSMMYADEIRSRLISTGICNARALQGLSADEIADRERKAGLIFPKQYVQFLVAAGRSAPGYFDGSIVYGDEVALLNSYFGESLEAHYRYLRETAEGAAETSEAQWRLPARALIFFGHSAYHYWYFVADGTDDPLVYSYK